VITSFAACERAQPHRGFLEDLVAARVAERVVDFLEAVEVDGEDREAAAGVERLRGLGQPLAEGGAVGQPGQRVVPAR
jgi:hypothetical protein